MRQRRFAKCLNLELRFFDVPAYAILFGVLGFSTGMFVMNFLAGVAVGSLGYVFGIYFSSLVHQGLLQRSIYKNMPNAKYYISKRITSSHRDTFI